MSGFKGTTALSTKDGAKKLVGALRGDEDLPAQFLLTEAKNGGWVVQSMLGDGNQPVLIAAYSGKVDLLSGLNASILPGGFDIGGASS